jgi:hypothetical protein
LSYFTLFLLSQPYSHSHRPQLCTSHPLTSSSYLHLSLSLPLLFRLFTSYSFASCSFSDLTALA